MEEPVHFADQSDEQLVDLYRQGRNGAFHALVSRYHLELYHFLVRFTGDRAAAEDLFQETFLQVHLAAESFDISRRFKPWLFTIAANKARDHLRRSGRRYAAELSAPVNSSAEDGQVFSDLLEGSLPLPPEELATKETRETVREVVAALPDHLREILILAYFQQFSYKEIAEMLGIPLGTVKSRLHAAVAAFAQQWMKLRDGQEE